MEGPRKEYIMDFKCRDKKSSQDTMAKGVSVNETEVDFRNVKMGSSVGENSDFKIMGQAGLLKFYCENISENRRISNKSIIILLKMFEYPILFKQVSSEKKDTNKQNLINLLQQITDTCFAYKELAYVQYNPNEYKIDEDSFIDSKKNNKKKIREFIIENITIKINKNTFTLFNPSLAKNFYSLIENEIKNDIFYNQGGYKETEYKTTGTKIVVPEANDGNRYCVYRSMAQEDYEPLLEYFKIKEAVENIIGKDIITFVSNDNKQLKLDEMEKINGFIKVRNYHPLYGHLGNLQQAITYGGILVKFIIKEDKKEVLVGKYLSKGGVLDLGKEGNIINNYIGAKSEGRGDFSFNVGKNLWSAILFLSAVEKIEVFDLRKKKDGQTKKGDFPIDIPLKKS